ncbi:GumC family protein [Pseudoalteromonas tunicata]|uniref:GumC family protein n=1 Tax=Pseudoalteromonas tunicata TaxID=314281 RepID=UPI00273D63E7|nr:Wzz/FepE/Etk N-terminal domain-containing protein [Pseudoalteromonas tunicata]MDP4985714.1 hypothetical protein [Pseudoalteromonas tunicata]MDP5212996.1 hypothetical protein [Pseudoalteromonas tunicata]
MEHGTYKNKKLPKQEQNQTIRDIVGIFFIKKTLFLGSFFAVVFAALAVVLLYPPIYEVNAKLVIKPQIETPVVFDKDVSRVNYENRVDTQMINTVIELLKSEPVMTEVVMSHHLAPSNDEFEIQKAILKLSAGFKAEPLSLSNIIQLKLRGGDPQAIVEQLNSIIDTYISYHINVNQTSKSSLDFFDKQTDTFQTRFTELTNNLANESQRVNVASPALQKENILQLIRDLEYRKTEVAMDTSSLNERLLLITKIKKNIKGDDKWVGLPRDILDSFPALIEMSKSLAQLIINKQRAMSDYLPDSKAVTDAESQYRNMHKQIHIQMKQIIDELETKVKSRQSELKEIEIKIAEAQQDLGLLTASSINLERLQLEHDLAKNNYTLYSTKREEARINLEKDQALFANVSIATRPVKPLVPWFPQKTKIMLMAIILAFFLAMGLCIAAYSLDQRVVMPNDIISKTKIRYLGSLDDTSA